MADQYILAAGIIASLVWFLFFYYNSFFGGLKKTRTASTKFPLKNCSNNTSNIGNNEAAGGDTDIIIVGAGVAGSALAYSLGKDGRRVGLIERDLNGPDRIAGEGLMPGGCLKLVELGLEDCLEEIDAQQLMGYSLYKDGTKADIAFPVAGKNFHNGRFVQRLREKAASHPNVSLEQGTVTSLLEENGTVKGVHYKTKSGGEHTAFAPLTIVCDGGSSNLRRFLCYSNAAVPSYFVGFILENCKLPHPKFGAIILTDPSPILFYPISTTELRCLVDVPSQNLPSFSTGEMAHYLKTRVAPKVPPELQTAFLSAIEKKNNIKIMQNRTMPAVPNPTPGALLMGDAFNMRHPITGGGMTVALSDVVVIRDLLRPLHNLHDASAVCKYLESFYTLRKPMASTINILASVLHKVFSAPSDPAMEELQKTCVRYLNLGGVFSNGLSALLSGLCPRPLSLALHFLALAMYGFGRLLLPFPSPKRVWTGLRFIMVALGIIFPLIKSEGIRPMFFPLTMPEYYRAPPDKNKDQKFSVTT